MRNTLEMGRNICLVSLFFILSYNGYAQGIPIVGKVMGAEGQPLAGVTVQVKGTDTKTASNTNGTYQITVPSAKSVLVFSYVGYGTQESAVNSKSQINIFLTAQAT